MKLASILTGITSAIAVTIVAFAAKAETPVAETYRLPGVHTEQHRDLIAGQININN